MAFGGRELRLILSVQSYGTTNIQRLRRDILSLAATTRAANSMQAAVQDEIVRKTERLAKLESRINAARMANTSRRAAAELALAESEMRFSRMRQRNAAQQIAAANAVARKQMQIAGSVLKADQMRTVGMQRFAVQEANLATRRLGIQQKINNFAAEEHGLTSRVLSNKATIMSRERQLRTLLGDRVNLERLATGNLGNYGAKVKETALRYRASLATQKQLSVLQKTQSGQLGIYNSQLAAVLEQEKLITAGKVHQAAEIERQVQLTALQRQELTQLLERQGEIEAELGVIDRQEALINEKHAQRLTTLDAELVAIQKQVIAYGEAAGELERMKTLGMENAAIADAQFKNQQRVMRRETRARTFAHGARTAQFAGLIGLAATALPAAAFAKFNQQTTLAATQLRGVGKGANDTIAQMNNLSDGMDRNGKHIAGILELMSKFPAPAEDMTQAAYDIASSMDVDSAGTLKLLKLFNELAVATGSDLNEATQAGITVLNDFGTASGSVSKRLNLMMAIIRFGRMRLVDLNAMLTKVAPAALAAGQSLEDVAGAMVLITRVQPSQRVGATGIARLLQTFRDPDFQRGIFSASKGLVDITKGAGAVGVLKPLPDIIDAIAHSFGLFQRFGGPQQLFKQLTAVGAGTGIGRQSRIEAANAFTFLIKFNKDYQRLQRETTGDVNEFSNALKAMSGAPGVQWQVFINGMRALAITFGEDILPSLLSLVGGLTKAAHWFENLSEGTRRLIGRMALFGAIGALIVGTFGNIIASSVALAANWRIMRGSMAATAAEAETTAMKLNLVGFAMRGIVGLGLISIPLIMQLIKGGDPGLWDFLSAAGFGAAGGFMLGGLPGAAIGAITVPIVLSFISPKATDVPKGTSKQIAKAYQDYLAQFQKVDRTFKNIFGGHLEGVATALSLGHIKSVKGFKEWLQEHPKYLQMWLRHLDKTKKGHTNFVDDLNKNWHKYVTDFKNVNNNLNQLYGQQNTRQSQAQQEAVKLAKHHAEAMKQALADRNQKIKDAVDNLGQIYESLRQQNEQAFGTIGQGPVMSGIFGSIFSQLNDLLYQFGVQIPIPFSLIRKDFDQQMKYFKRFNADLAKLSKRGAPFPLIQQIQAMGPQAGIPIAEGLLSGGKKGFKQLMKEWKTGQKLLDKVTKQQLDAQLKYWESFGKSAAWKLVNGVTSSPAWAKLAPHFRKYVVNTFGGILRRQLNQEVAKDMAAFRKSLQEEAAAAAAAAPKMPTGPTPTTTTAHLQHHQRTVKQLQRQANKAKQLVDSYSREIASANVAALNPLGPGGSLYTRSELANIRVLQRRRRRFQQQARRTQRAVNTALMHGRGPEARSIQYQLMHREPNARGMVTVVYHGDTVHVHTGASVKDVEKALDRQAFRRRNKKYRHTKSKGR